MNCLVVKAHPLNNSLCTCLTNHIVQQLVENGHQVHLDDLYADSFQPVLSVNERRSYYEQLYDNSEVSEYAEKLVRADGLVLVFPTWWFGFPAILKGWFDRVWSPGLAYDHATDYGPIHPRLNNLQRVLVVTTLGAPWWVDWLIMRRPVRKVVKLALLGACARQSRLQYLSLYKSEKLSDEQVHKFLIKIDKLLARWKA